MKLITLNIWGGQVKKPLLDFIKAQQEVDIFCFQEVYHNAPEKICTSAETKSLSIFSELHDLLPEHDAYFRPAVRNIYGLGTFIRKNIPVLREGDVTIHANPEYTGSGPSHPRNMQWLECQVQDTVYTIMNVHGLWNGMGKTDTPARIAQSQCIREFMDNIPFPKILCGDLNLRPDTESLRLIEENMRNQVLIHNIQSTRTSLYPKPEKYADYIFTSPEISVQKFAVLNDEVSDHSPLFLEFKL